MPQAVVFIAPKDTPIEIFRTSIDNGDLRFFVNVPMSDLQIQDRNGTWYVNIDLMNRSHEILDEYLENDLLDWEFRSSLDRHKIYMNITFNDFVAARWVLSATLCSLGDVARDCWIDTDYGWVIRGDQFLERVRNNPDWDWRKKSA